MKLCPYPFSRLQTNYTDGSITERKEAFFPCCPSWFTEEYHQMQREDNIEDIWNGKAAVELRRRMYEGDFSLCNRTTCQIPLFTVEELADRKIMFVETPISEENIEAIKRRDPVMPNSPASLHLSADLTCNLTCGSCRPQIIPNTKPSKAAQEEADYVKKSREHVEIVKMSSGGEVFYSTLQRQLLKSFNSEDFPKLKRVHIVSNGTLFNQKTYNDLAPGTSFIKDVSISLDAGSKEVYEKIRGPYWEQVLGNLRWMSEMRKAGKFDFFSINFIMQKGNFRDIPNLVKLGKELNVDRILVQRYLAYPDQGFKTPEEQLDQSVHLPTHPDYPEMVRILEEYKDEPKLYTLLDIPGFEKKISTAVDIQKAKGLQFRAAALSNLGRNEEALKIIEESISFSPLIRSFEIEANLQVQMNGPFHDYFQLIHLGFQSAKKGNNDAATDAFSKAILLEPPYKRGQAQKGLFYQLMESGYRDRENGRPQQAESNFREALKFEHIERKGEASIALYYTLMKIGQEKNEKGLTEESLPYFREALSLEPEESRGEAGKALYFGIMHRGFSSRTSKDFPSAIAFFNEASSYEPEDKKGEAAKFSYYSYLDAGAGCKEAGQINEALELFRKAQLIEPEDKSGETALAIFCCLVDEGFREKEEGNPEAALFWFEEAQKHEPLEKRGEAHSFIKDLNYHRFREEGFELQRKGKYSAAVESFYKALKWNEADGDLLFSLGISLKRTKQFKKAEESFIKSLEKKPDNYWTILELGYLELRKNNRKQALAYFLKGKEIEPASKPGHTNKYIMLSRRNPAFNVFRRRVRAVLK